MSIHVSTAIWERSSHKGSALLLLLYLGDCAHEDGTNVWPSVATMAKRTRMSQRSTQYLLQFLVASGELEMAGVSPSKTNLYSVKLDALGRKPVNYKAFLQGKGIAGTIGGKTQKEVRAEDANTCEAQTLHPATGCAKRMQALAAKPSVEPSTIIQGSLLFQIPEFESEWKHFLAHRKKLRKPMSEHAQELLLATLSGRPDQAVAALQMAMTRGWSGIQWDWMDNQNQKRANGAHKTSDSVNRNVGTANYGKSSQYAGVGKVIGHKQL